MNRTILFSLCAVMAVAVTLLASTSAMSAGGQSGALVRLQSSTPGFAQSGHANLSGTVTAGQFSGGGTALTALSASNITSGTLADGRLSGNVAVKGNSNVFTAINQFNGFVGISRSTPITGAELFGIQGPATGFGGMYINAGGPAGQPFYGYSLQGIGIAYHYIDGTDANKWKLFNSGSFLTFSAAGNLGVGTTSPQTRLDVSGVAQVSGLRMPAGASAGYLLTSDGAGNASWQAFPNPLTLASNQPGSHTIKGSNSATTNGSAGVIGESTGTAPSGTSYGVYGRNLNALGYGGYFTSAGVGLRAESTGNDAFTATTNGANFSAVFGRNTANTGHAYGGFFQTTSPQGQALYANAASSTSAGYAGLFETDSTTGTCLRARAPGSGDGVRGESATGFGVYAVGNMGASGNKSFRIDHPLDPLNKYLLHYCAEGPEPRNVYQGHVTTDKDGYAWVDLPAYYAEINCDPEYTLTVLDSSDDFVLAKVTHKVAGNRFQIRTSKPEVEVSWRVEGIRNDAWVQQHGAPVEVEKQGREKGKYQHPELYRAPPEMGMNYRPEMDGKGGKPKGR